MKTLFLTLGLVLGSVVISGCAQQEEGVVVIGGDPSVGGNF